MARRRLHPSHSPLPEAPYAPEETEEDEAAQEWETEEEFEEDEEGWEDEPPSRGLGFFLFGLLLSFAVIGAGAWALRAIVAGGYLDRLAYTFDEDVSLLPDAGFRPPSSEHTVRLFLTHDGRTLTAHTRRLRAVVGDAEKARLILTELFSPPPSALFRPATPAGTSVRGYYQLGRTAYLDLSEEFLAPRAPTPQGERLAIYAVVNSLVLNVESIDSVQLLVGGETIETAWGWLDCSSPLGANLSVIE